MNLFTIKSSAGNRISVVPMTDATHPQLLQGAKAFQTESDFGDMLFQNVSSRSAGLWYSIYRMPREEVIYGTVEDPVFEAHITLKDRYVQSARINRDEIYRTGQLNITAAPFIENKVFFPKDGEYITFDIHPSDALLQNLAQDFPGLYEFLNKLEQKPQYPISLFPTPVFASPEINQLIFKILAHLKSPNYKKIYFEILLQELFMLILLRQEQIKWRHWKIKPRDIEALHCTREFIIKEGLEYDSEDLYDTAIQLAEKSNLSLFKLKNGFKQLFGTTPYQLLLETRLHRARELLKDTDASILAIALEIGYQSAESFSKAYKNLFKVAPSQERK